MVFVRKIIFLIPLFLKKMKIFFRVDASISIGSGHVMRCLALADFLRKQGNTCFFVCREFSGNLIDLIKSLGFFVFSLPNFKFDCPNNFSKLDCEETKNIFSAVDNDNLPDWLIVDHYSLGYSWETGVKSFVEKILAIDDLANRPHNCDVLVDQNLGRTSVDYSKLTPSSSFILAGPKYSLLRSEFYEWREFSLNRRLESTSLNNIFISLGGVDADNVTCCVLSALKNFCLFLPSHLKITVVMGKHAPHVGSVREMAHSMPWDTCVKVGVSNMAELMSYSDIAIGAGGGSAWERCCLGVPSLIVILADNQIAGANALDKNHISESLGAYKEVSTRLPNAIKRLCSHSIRSEVSLRSSELVDGRGCYRIIEAMSGV